MELLQKDEKTGAPLAKCRAAIWASAFARLGAMFYAATGTRLRSDMKIMARVNVGFHAVYGLSLIITDINPDYTPWATSPGAATKSYAGYRPKAYSTSTAPCNGPQCRPAWQWCRHVALPDTATS